MTVAAARAWMGAKEMALDWRWRAGMRERELRT
jgi:hypothetical protein